VEEFYMLGLALLVGGIAITTFALWFATAGKERRQRRIAREHARSKLR
jgi:hypothetical protein